MAGQDLLSNIGTCTQLNAKYTLENSGAGAAPTPSAAPSPAPAAVAAPEPTTSAAASTAARLGATLLGAAAAAVMLL